MFMPDVMETSIATRVAAGRNTTPAAGRMSIGQWALPDRHVTALHRAMSAATPPHSWIATAAHEWTVPSGRVISTAPAGQVRGVTDRAAEVAASAAAGSAGAVAGSAAADDA